MATDDPDPGEEEPAAGGDDNLERARERIEEEAERAVDEFDRNVVDLLSWLLDTETRARIYVHLRQHPEATSQEIADGTGLYPSTVREALSDLHEEGVVVRGKRENDGAGNNPYEYRAIAPSDLVRSAVGDIQSELNAVFNLDERLGGASADTTEPVNITVEEAGAADDEGDADAEEDAS